MSKYIKAFTRQKEKNIVKDLELKINQKILFLNNLLDDMMGKETYEGKDIIFGEINALQYVLTYIQDHYPEDKPVS